MSVITEGMKSSEFRVALVGILLGIAMYSGVISPEQISAVVEIAEKIAGALLTAFSVAGYEVSRGLAKKEVK